VQAANNPLLINSNRGFQRLWLHKGFDSEPILFAAHLVKGVPTGFVATVLGDGEEVVRKHYSKWIPERQAALETAIRSTWKPISSADARQTKKTQSKQLHKH
jgi:hypothetical protein